MAAQKQDDQLERTFSSYVRIQDVVLKTYLGRWTIGRSGERGSGISGLPARYDDDDDDIILYYINKFRFIILKVFVRIRIYYIILYHINKFHFIILKVFARTNISKVLLFILDSDLYITFVICLKHSFLISLSFLLYFTLCRFFIPVPSGCFSQEFDRKSLQNSKTLRNRLIDFRTALLHDPQ